jgi:dipeptidyl aminopeptidase/acylaminoacyl peptidase
LNGSAKEEKYMTTRKVAPYGSWKSPITSDLIVTETVEFGQIFLDGEDIYWIEMRPAEGGRYVVVRYTNEGTADCIPPPFNARTRVHEYGGGAYLVTDGTIYFSNFDDQRLYSQKCGDSPQPITPKKNLRYADGILDQSGHIICIQEDHTQGDREAVNALVSISLDDGESRVLVSGNDFYASPRLSPNGSQLAWLTWNHPNMPWNGTELWVGEIQEDGSLSNTQLVAGGIDESIFQPEWSPDGVLHFVSDRTGWWNLYCWHNEEPAPLCPMEAEFGVPQWRFRRTTYGFESRNSIICTYTQKGVWHLARLDTTTGALERLETPYDSIKSLQVAAGYAVFVASSPTEQKSVLRLDLASKELKVLRQSSTITIDPEYLSVPQTIEFPTGRQPAYAFFYPPQNRDFIPAPHELPPLLVISHGGPTEASSSSLNLKIQYWTSRGFSVLDVNYGGSTGYGREYRERLMGQWGIVDVDDCIHGVQYLVSHDEVDQKRLAIRGGSAGGYTTLCALTFTNVFKAGASHYGVSDLEALTKETHKFESHYLDRLIGPYPESLKTYEERSPINFTERLSCPVIFFQGLEDKIVLPNQAELMVEALKKKGVPVAYVAFEGEQHGFRRSENMKRALDAELYFYSKIFDFELAEPVEPVPIENL